MKVFRGLPNADAKAPCALTIGNFDGVHLGHQALLAQVRAAATRLNVEAAVMTFEPTPRAYFAQQAGDIARAPTRIANLRDKLQALAGAGIDRVIVEHFNHHFAAISPDDFAEKILQQGLHVKWLMVGEDFCYGARRAGNLATLIEAGKKHGFEVHALPTVRAAGTRVSSSAVREALAQGDLAHARQLLGRPFSISGRVMHGGKLGRTLGFPTLNLRLARERAAISGVYVVQVHGLAEGPLPAVASVGTRPTVDNSGRMLLEVHVFDFSANCYGKLVRIEFLEKLRDEEKYGSLALLTAAIARDGANARAYFARAAAASAQPDAGSGPI